MPAIRTIAAAVNVLLSVVAASTISAQASKECTAAATIGASGSVNANQQSAYLTLTASGLTGANAFATGIPKNA